MNLQNKRFTIIFILILVMLMPACTKQEAPSIENGERPNQREIERLEACSGVNFNKGVLLHYNAILLFKCSKWDEDFPHLYRALRKIQGAYWDHVMGPIDEAFVSDLRRRERVFKNIRDLDSKNGLDDLSRVIVALNETNFFDSVRTMLLCADDPTAESCRGRENIATKSSLSNILKFVDTNPKTIDKMSSIIKNLITSLGKNQEELRSEINKFRQDPLFVKMRLLVPDAFAKKAKMGLSLEDREFAKKVLLTSDSSGEVPWLYTWLHDEKMSREKFRDLMEYPLLTNPIFVDEIKGLKRAYDDDFHCSIKSTTDPNEMLGFDFKTHLENYTTVLKTRSYKNFYDYMAGSIFGLKMSAEVCGELESSKYNVNFIKMLGNLANFLGEKKFYELTKFLITHTTAKGDPDKTFSENLYLLDMVASDIFSSANLLNQRIVHHTRNFYPEIYDLIYQLPPEAFINIGEVITEFLKEDNDKKLKGLADFWSFFTPPEKNFLFNFIDRHFEGDTQFVLLFDFYAKFLDDLREVQPLLKDRWIGTEAAEEISYLSVQNIVTELAGKDTLEDFKRFFGRDQILRVLEVISNGAQIAANAKEELSYIKSHEYINQAKTEKYKFEVSYDPGKDDGYNAGPVIECMNKFSEMENGFYYLIKKLPAACAKVAEDNIAFRLFGWMNAIESSYKEFNPGKTQSDSFLDEKGLMSPLMLNTAIGVGKILDSILGDVDSKLPTKNGVRYAMNAAKFHLEEQGAAQVIDRDLNLMKKWFSVYPEDNIVHRNALVKAFTREENFSQANLVMRNVAGLAIKYNEWIKEGSLAKTENRSLGTYDPHFDCEKVINQVISPNPCPSRSVVKTHTNGVLKYLTMKWEDDLGTPVGLLLKAVKPGEGLNIPLGTSNTKKYRMTLKETFKYLYDTSDPALPVNKLKVYYVDEQGQGTNQTVTTLERVESVIREVRFDNNYLGAAYLNAITHAKDYNDEAKKRKKLLSTCVNIPVVRCSRKMSDNDLRMAKNSIETFDGLIDANNGRGLEEHFNYGDFLKTFQQTLVGSSAKKAQEVQLFPLKDELLLQHNGRLLGEMTLMTMWSNAARVIRDRVGRTRKDFENFIESREFNRVDRSLLYGFSLPETVPSAERLIKKLQIVPQREKQNVVDHSIDWVASLNYDQTRLLEDTVSRLLVVASYLGSPDVVFGKFAAKKKDGDLSITYSSSFDRYKDNNLSQVFMSLEKIIDHWPTIKNFFPAEMKLIDALKPVNNMLVFLTHSLGSSDDPEKNVAYRALNDLFIVMRTAVLDDLPDPRLAYLNQKTIKGLDVLTGFLSNSQYINQTYYTIKDNYDYLGKLHVNEGSWFKAFGQNVQRMTDDGRIDLTPLRDYLSFTTKSEICLNTTIACVPNYHFDEVANLIKFLNDGPVGKETNFMLMTRKIFAENLNDLMGLFDDLIPAIKIKEIKPPLRLN